jgi:hypothetical protein
VKSVADMRMYCQVVLGRACMAVSWDMVGVESRVWDGRVELMRWLAALADVRGSEVRAVKEASAEARQASNNCAESLGRC